MADHTMLFLGADPTGGTFGLGEELAAVRAELERYEHAPFAIVADLDVEPTEVQSLLNRVRPTLVHFSGHVTEDGRIVFVGSDGQARFVSGDLLRRILAGAAGTLRCLVLNACNGAVIAPMVAPVADVVVALEGMVTVRAARLFSMRFYEALAAGRSARQAYEQAGFEVELAGLGHEASAVLLEREPGMAEGLVLAPATAEARPERIGAASTKRRGIFISYAHEDEPWKERVTAMLRPLERSVGIEVWEDRRIAPSSDWRTEIEQALARARVAILLVSAQFLASDFIHEQELPVILQARERGELEVLWVYVAPCLLGATPLGAIQAAHSPMAPLAGMALAEQEAALLQVAQRAGQILQGS